MELGFPPEFLQDWGCTAVTAARTGYWTRIPGATIIPCQVPNDNARFLVITHIQRRAREYGKVFKCLLTKGAMRKCSPSGPRWRPVDPLVAAFTSLASRGSDSRAAISMSRGVRVRLDAMPKLC
jgi:hypothetical protein